MVGEQVGALLVHDQRILLCLRANTRRFFPGVWDVPGGHVEPGETATAALRRELREELGIAAEVPDGPPGLRVDDERVGLQLALWVVRAWSGMPVNRCPDEHARISWFTAAETQALTLADERYRPLIRTILSGAG